MVLLYIYDIGAVIIYIICYSNGEWIVVEENLFQGWMLKEIIYLILLLLLAYDLNKFEVFYIYGSFSFFLFVAVVDVIVVKEKIA